LKILDRYLVREIVPPLEEDRRQDRDLASLDEWIASGIPGDLAQVEAF
jgi:histidine ammonia-lyase